MLWRYIKSFRFLYKTYKNLKKKTTKQRRCITTYTHPCFYKLQKLSNQCLKNKQNIPAAVIGCSCSHKCCRRKFELSRFSLFDRHQVIHWHYTLIRWLLDKCKHCKRLFACAYEWYTRHKCLRKLVDVVSLSLKKDYKFFLVW
jgi:hypothetical protein